MTIGIYYWGLILEMKVKSVNIGYGEKENGIDYLIFCFILFSNIFWWDRLDELEYFERKELMMMLFLSAKFDNW